MRRKLNSRGELKIDGALCDPRPASSTDAEREFETLFLLGYLHIFTYFVYVSLISVCLRGYVNNKSQLVAIYSYLTTEAFQITIKHVESIFVTS